MQKVTLSALAALVVSGAAYADTMTLYTDPATGQVFTAPAEGRVEMGDFIDAKTVYLENQAQDSAIAKEKSKDKSTKTYAKASKLQFSGQHYIGYTYQANENADATGDSHDTGKFELRRNYVQVKAYLFDDPKSYMRVTLDAKQNPNLDKGSMDVRVKYAFLYLDDILPYTGVEIGLAHRPWLDYEEHQGWWYRCIDETFNESHQGAHLWNSADFGFNLKTKTPYFTSEVGIFNGEGYHEIETQNGVSAEWRLTAAILGNGDQKRKQRKSTYWDASFHGKYNTQNSSNNNETFGVYGLHTVYNMPEFLIAAHYTQADNDAPNTTSKNGSGYSVNAEYRFGSDLEFALLARVDRWTPENSTTDVESPEHQHELYGIAWEQNSNVTWVLNGKHYKEEDTSAGEFNSYMLTAEINW